MYLTRGGGRNKRQKEGFGNQRAFQGNEEKTRLSPRVGARRGKQNKSIFFDESVSQPSQYGCAGGLNPREGKRARQKSGQ